MWTSFNSIVWSHRHCKPPHPRTMRDTRDGMSPEILKYQWGMAGRHRWPCDVHFLRSLRVARSPQPLESSNAVGEHSLNGAPVEGVHDGWPDRCSLPELCWGSKGMHWPATLQRHRRSLSPKSCVLRVRYVQFLFDVCICVKSSANGPEIQEQKCKPTNYKRRVVARCGSSRINSKGFKRKFAQYCRLSSVDARVGEKKIIFATVSPIRV